MNFQKLAEEIDSLLETLLDDTEDSSAQDLDPDFFGKKPESISQSVVQPTETYQLPVQVGRLGQSLDEGDKPWIVGHFLPNQYVNETHKSGHNGLDLKAPKGTPVYAIASGIVKATGVGAISGNYVTLLHEDGHVQSFYGHLDSISTQQGQKVTKSSVIGKVGDSGSAFQRGSHLHFEIKIDGRLIDPMSVANKLVGSLSKKASAIDEIIKMADIFCSS